MHYQDRKSVRIFSLLLAMLLSGACWAQGDLNGILNDHNPTSDGLGQPTSQQEKTTAAAPRTTAPMSDAEKSMLNMLDRLTKILGQLVDIFGQLVDAIANKQGTVPSTKPVVKPPVPKPAPPTVAAKPAPKPAPIPGPKPPTPAKPSGSGTTGASSTGTAVTIDGVKGKGFENNGRLNVPIRSQREPANGELGSSFCGPTSLAMAMQYWGVNKETREVAVKCHTISPSGKWQGTYSGNLAAAAREYGLKGSYLKQNASVDWLKKTVESGVPVVINVDTSGYWPKGHYMVCTGVKDGKVYLNDPWLGKERSYSLSTFLAQWATRSHICIVVKP